MTAFVRFMRNQTVRKFALLIVPVLLWGQASLAQDPIVPSAPAGKASPATAEPATPIPLRSPDRVIRNRLLELFGEIEGLRQVAVQVRGGVVTLSGTVLDIEAREEAENVASRVAGVASVENELRTERRLERRLEPLIAQGRALTASVLALLPLLAIALLVFAAFWFAGAMFTRRTNLFRRLAPNPFIEALFEQIVRLLFIIAGLVVAMNILGATALIGTVLGAAGVIGLAVGFAVRDTIENYIASILLSIRQPFRPNDAVNIEGVDGRVTTLNSRATIITTWDGNEVRIPNAVVYKAKIVNYTHTPERRFDFELRIDPETDLSCALATALRGAKGAEGVMAEPAPAALLDRVEDYAFVLKVLAWVDQSKSDFNKVRSEAIRAVKDAFQAEGIELIRPVQKVLQLAEDEPRAAEAEPRTAPRQPSHQEMREIKDTSADTTIDEKVQARRESADNDLLTAAAPRE